MQTTVGTSAEHHRRLRLQEYDIELWEDGLRTQVAETSFEWWYFNSDLEDGSKLSVEFHTKPPYVSPSSALSPFILLTLERPNQPRLQKVLTAPAESFFASRERCDVRIGDNVFEGDLLRYRIRATVEDVSVDITLKTTVRGVRPGTGHVFFGADEARYVAWLPAVPRGDVLATVTHAGHTETLRGIGYHDHNWGNTALRKLVDHWYWGRAHIGEYTAITLMFVSHQDYGKQSIAAFLLAKGSEVIATGGDEVTFTADELSVSPESGIPFAKRLVYVLEQANVRTSVTFQHRENVFMMDFGKAGAYQRFHGEVVIERGSQNDPSAHASVRGEALWELLYFGPRQPAGGTK